MVLTLRDVVESRGAQRAADVRRTSAERLDGDRYRNERFSLDDIDQCDGREARARTSARSGNDAVQSFPGRSVRGPSDTSADKPAKRGAVPIDGTKVKDTKPDAGKTDAPGPEESEPEVRGPAAKTEVPGPDVSELTVSTPIVAKPTVAGAAKAVLDIEGADTDRTAADTSTSTQSDAVESDVAAPEAGTSVTADAVPATARGEASPAKSSPARISTSDGKERLQISAKPAEARQVAPNRTSSPPPTSGVTAESEGAVSETETAKPTTALTSGETDESGDGSRLGDATASAMPMMAVFATPVVPMLPIHSAISPINGFRQGGASDIEAAGAATAGASGLSAGAGLGRTPTMARPGFAATLAETVEKNSGGDAIAAASPQGAETSGTVGAAAPPSGPAETKAAAATHQETPAAASSLPMPLGAVPMTIGLRALGTSSRFEIRLDPKELGRIDVSIDIDKDSGTVGARLVVDRPETLALLQRDASSLQQALAQTGLDASAGISLSLRGGDGQDQRNSGDPSADSQGHRAGRTSRIDSQSGSDQPAIDLAPIRTLRGLARVDIRI